jgi:hypothetical protein
MAGMNRPNLNIASGHARPQGHKVDLSFNNPKGVTYDSYC